MNDDILTTVKAALDAHDRGQCGCLTADNGGVIIACRANGAHDWLRALIERCEATDAKLLDALECVRQGVKQSCRVYRIQQEFADDLADRDGNIYEQFKDFREQFYAERAERDALRQQCEAAEAIVAQVQDFVQRERALRDNISRGGQHVNGGVPSISPSVLRELERMIRDAPYVAANYRKMEDCAKTAEASYQEAQLTIAGLEAERDHYRTALQALTVDKRRCHALLSSAESMIDPAICPALIDEIGRELSGCHNGSCTDECEIARVASAEAAFRAGFNDGAQAPTSDPELAWADYKARAR